MATQEQPIHLATGIAGATPPTMGFSTKRRPYYIFDSASEQTIVFPSRVPLDYVGTAVLLIDWSGSTSTTVTHTVRWGCTVMAYTPETDSADATTDSFDTQNTVDDDILGTTAKRIQQVAMTLTNADSMAAGDRVWYEFSRPVALDLAEDAYLWGLALRYSDA